MTELQRQLQEVVAYRYGGKARPASLEAKLNPNQVSNILSGATQIPDLETLDKLCRAFNWRLEDAVYWALGLEPPADPDPLVAIEQHLARLRIGEDQRAALLVMIRQFIRTRPAFETEKS